MRNAAPEPRREFAGSLVFLAIAMLPCLSGGILLLFANTAGLYWLAAVVILSFRKPFLDAWAPLIEINRLSVRAAAESPRGRPRTIHVWNRRRGHSQRESIQL